MNTEKTPGLPRIRNVTPAKTSFVLDVTWQDGSHSRVDLSGLIHRSRHFRVFADRPTEFRKVRVVDFGSGVGWDNGLDYAATTLRTMADEQKRMKGSDLAEFELRNGLNTRETAALLGVAERTVRAWRRARAVPQPVATAVRALEADSTVFAAHYKPLASRPRGRPRKRVAASGVRGSA
jgi:hypothetical protein